MAASIFWLKCDHIRGEYDDSYVYDLDFSFSLAGGDGAEARERIMRHAWARNAVRAGWLRNRPIGTVRSAEHSARSLPGDPFGAVHPSSQLP